MAQSKPRPKIKSSFGEAITKMKQQTAEPEQKSDNLVSQSPSISGTQDTKISGDGAKKVKERRTKKAVYLKPATARWLNIQAATEEKEISEIAEEALTILQKIKSGKAELVENG